MPGLKNQGHVRMQVNTLQYANDIQIPYVAVTRPDTLLRSRQNAPQVPWSST